MFSTWKKAAFSYEKRNAYVVFPFGAYLKIDKRHKCRKKKVILRFRELL